MVKNLPANAGDAREVGSIHRLGGLLGVRNDKSLQYFCLENSMSKRAWQAIVYGAAKSWSTRMERIVQLFPLCPPCII